MKFFFFRTGLDYRKREQYIFLMIIYPLHQFFIETFALQLNTKGEELDFKLLKRTLHLEVFFHVFPEFEPVSFPTLVATLLKSNNPRNKKFRNLATNCTLKNENSNLQ